MAETGLVTAVVHSTLGNELDGAHSSPTSTLTLLDAVDFPDTGGQLSINGDVLDFTATDDDTVITLAAPYSGVVDEGTRVDVYPAAVEVTAYVQVAGQDDSYPCVLPHHMKHLLPEGERGSDDVRETVTVDDSGSQWVVTQVHGEQSRFATDVEVTGRLLVYDADGRLAIVLDGETAQLVANDPDGLAAVIIDGLTGKLTAVGQVTTGFDGEPRVVLEDSDLLSRAAVLFHTANVAEVTPARIESTYSAELLGNAYTLVLQAADAGDALGAYLRLRTIPDAEISTAELGTNLFEVHAETTTFRQEATAALEARANDGALVRMNLLASSFAVDSGLGGGGVNVIRGNEVVSRSADLSERETQLVGGSYVEVDFDSAAGGTKAVRFREAPDSPGAYGQMLAVKAGATGGVGIVLVDAGGDNSNDAVRISNAPGDGTRDLYCAVLHETSDRAVKRKIADVEGGALDVVLALRPRVFERKASGVTQAGFVAQEVAEHLPVAVTGPDGDMALSSMSLLAYAVKGMQEQQAQIDDLTERLARLEG